MLSADANCSDRDLVELEREGGHSADLFDTGRIERLQIGISRNEGQQRADVCLLLPRIRGVFDALQERAVVVVDTGVDDVVNRDTFQLRLDVLDFLCEKNGDDNYSAILACVE